MPSDEHPPAFLLYVRDLVSDAKVELMTTEEFGAYILLLCKAWYEKPVATIPDDDRVLACWARLTPEKWSQCRGAVLACFKPCQGNRFVQPRLLKEYQKLMTSKKKKSIAGKAGADKRWNGDGNAMAPPKQRHGSVMADPMRSHGIATQNQLTPDLEETNNPKGGSGA